MTFTITLTEKELDYVAGVLATRPYGEVAQLLQNLKRQLDEQQAQKQIGLQANSGLNGHHGINADH